MKYSPYVLGLLISIACLNVKAQLNESVVSVLARGCNTIFLQFGWQDGQAVLVRNVQEIIKTMQLPKEFTIAPKEALDTLANLNAIDIPQLIFHCTTDDQQRSPNVVAKFYFSYILPDQTPMRTPEIVVSRVVPVNTSTPTTITTPVATTPETTPETTTDTPITTTPTITPPITTTTMPPTTTNTNEPQQN